MRIRFQILISLLLYLYAGSLYAQEYIDKSMHIYPITQDASVEVANKYGKIHVITWDVDSIKFEVDLHINTNNIEKLQKLRNNISFDFTATKYYIIAKTNFANAGNVITDFKDALIPSNQITINFIISLPKQSNLKIVHKYGDIYIDDFAGNLEITLSNGDLKANSLTGNSIIKINSGNGTINNIQGGKVFVSYGNMHIRQSCDIETETKSSKITIDKAENIKLDSRRDKYEIARADNLSATGYFTDFQIGQLSKELRCSAKYGNISVFTVEEGFSFINLNSEYTDLDLFFDRNVSFNIDIAHSNDVIINMPVNSSQVQTTDLNLEQKMKLSYGKIGSKTNEMSPKVTISATKKCVINIGQK